ncbi:MAG: imidazole glycerol phosphate synthase subunit HisH [Thermoplasmata archaeon]|nr:imidazole glycerol phosphate synthase subunit HisH [Thermoplasmata archaeon]
MTVRVELLRTPAGNFGRLRRGLELAGARVRWARPDRLPEDPQALVLAGVSAFGTTAHALRPCRRAVLGLAERGVPVLGVCAGFQAFFGSSAESPGRGLQLLPGNVRELRSRRVPHLGWSRLERIRPDSWLLWGVPAGSYVYFAHSYRAPGRLRATIAETRYGGEWYPSAVELGSVGGLQFHPEISGRVGARVLRNFVRFAEERS